jgi:nucleoside-diphosphate-sugar epimerase
MRCRNREGRRLYTCALRPAAIYGPGEERHFPRILRLAEAELYLFHIGGSDTKQDWVYVDNLVHAQLLASMALLDDIPDRGVKVPAAGQAYFISDGKFVCGSFEVFQEVHISSKKLLKQLCQSRMK